MKSILLTLTIVCLSLLDIQASEKRDFLTKHYNEQQVKELLVTNQKWVPYPSYKNRQEWDRFLGTTKEDYIKTAEKYLNYNWQHVKATDYLEFYRSGDRDIMQAPFNANSRAFTALMVGELAEGKGRFIDQIVNGIYFYCEMTTWALSAHIGPAQKKRSNLPNHQEHIIDLGSGGLSANLAWAYYFFQEPLKHTSPIIVERLYQTLQERTIDTYLNNNHFWWLGFRGEGQVVNNWNPWCNSNVLLTAALIETDADRLAKLTYRSMQSVDQFINYTKADGACEEGPSYWGHAAGKMYDYLKILSSLTSGKITIFQEPMIRKMGEYICRSYIGSGWVVNFADASAKGGGEADLIFSYGKAIDSDQMKQYAAYLSSKQKYQSPSTGDFFRMLEALSIRQELSNTPARLIKAPFTWYDETEFCYIRGESMFLAAKGGFNNESHNHNDVGSFLLYVNEQPVLVDVGVGTYSRQTFSSERYTIWTMQSDYHNLPVVNGFSQKEGAQYKATGSSFDSKKNTFTTDIAKAYPQQAAIEKWQRSLTLNKQGVLVRESFAMDTIKQAHTIHLICAQQPVLAGDNLLQLAVIDGQKVLLKYDSKRFEVTIQPIDVKDPRLTKVWGEQLYRIALKAKNADKKGEYTYNIYLNNEK